METLKLTKEDLIAVIYCLQQISKIEENSKDVADLKKLLLGTISILLNYLIGNNNSSLVWNYAYDNDNNKFNSINELYQYLLDPYSQYVRLDTALTISQLRQLFPDEKMFQVFEEMCYPYLKKK